MSKFKKSQGNKKSKTLSSFAQLAAKTDLGTNKDAAVAVSTSKPSKKGYSVAVISGGYMTAEAVALAFDKSSAKGQLGVLLASVVLALAAEKEAREVKVFTHAAFLSADPAHVELDEAVKATHKAVGVARKAKEEALADYGTCTPATAPAAREALKATALEAMAAEEKAIAANDAAVAAYKAAKAKWEAGLTNQALKKGFETVSLLTAVGEPIKSLVEATKQNGIADLHAFVGKAMGKAYTLFMADGHVASTQEFNANGGALKHELMDVLRDEAMVPIAKKFLADYVAAVAARKAERQRLQALQEELKAASFGTIKTPESVDIKTLEESLKAEAKTTTTKPSAKGGSKTSK